MEMPYNFISIPDKVFNLWKRGMDYTVDKISLFNFILFCLLMVAVPICVAIVTPILLLAGIEHLFYTIMDYLDERIGHDNPLVHFMTVFGIMIMLVPTLTFVGPSLIWHNIKKYRVKKREERTRLTLEQINNDIQQWYTIKRVEDFKPKHRLKAHTFNKKRKERFISPGVYIEGNMSTASGYNSIAIGHNNTVAGYYNNNGQPNRIRYE
jgi:hypothetical protein